MRSKTFEVLCLCKSTLHERILDPACPTHGTLAEGERHAMSEAVRQAARETQAAWDAQKLVSVKCEHVYQDGFCLKCGETP